MGQSVRESESVDVGKRRPTFRRNVLPSTFGVLQPEKRLFSPLDTEDDGTTFLRNVGNELPVDTA